MSWIGTFTLFVGLSFEDVALEGRSNDCQELEVVEVSVTLQASTSGHIFKCA